ncbi:fimbrial biogenesis outer membrane usher protein [Caballeronia telluris]|uniref:Fimbrial biogenesis outer membrane usher protein n=2 Tax=Caballeronia telluris TaxID=326475 RepID=A0A158ERM4_9BURK|nr:fimbrial biogenesis outer membrane usher protein [Caballeronia telluris]
MKSPVSRISNQDDVAFRLKPLAAISLVMMTCAALPEANAANVNADTTRPGAADEVQFDNIFLRTQAGQSVDVGRFMRGNVVSPGTYLVELVVNGARVSREEIRFASEGGGAGARPCLSRALLQRVGVDLGKADAAAGRAANAAAAEAEVCGDIGGLVPGASVDFDFEEQRLDVSVPQAYMRNSARGYVSPDLWDQGVNAGFLSYNANTFRTGGSGLDSTQSYLGVNAGVNVGAWHFRHQSSVTSSTGHATQLDNIATYVQHDVEKLRAQVTLGDSYTTGEIFDSVSFRGAQIATDDRMLPESLRGYAPVVRGTAESNARVTVRQNGQVLLETNVSPGPFEINDLYSTGYGGDLVVTVTEADGRTKTFTVPFASVAQLLRPGVTRFSATAGELRNNSLEDKPVFGQFTVQRGLTNTVTAYGGAVASTGYGAVNLGAALNTRVGAFSMDVTGSQTDVPDHSSMHGASLRIGYSKSFAPTDTNVAVAAYRFSSEGFLNLNDAASVRDIANRGGDIDALFRQRNRVQVTVNQRLGEHGTVYLTGSSQNYWNRSGTDTLYQAGYTNSFKYGTYSVTAGRNRTMDGRLSNEFMLSTTLPLGSSSYAPTLTTNITHNSDGATNTQANIGGSLGEFNQFTYNGYGNYNAGGAASSGTTGVSGTYRAPDATFNASASGGSGVNQISAGVAGSVVAHPGGVTFSQTVGDTFGIVQAPAAKGANVLSSPGTKVDSHGYAVIPYLSPYSMNGVDLDPKGTSTDVEFKSTSVQVAPRAGSVVMLKYDTVTGRAAMIRAPKLGDGALPFGASVEDVAGRSVGVVGQGSRIFARGLEDSGVLNVKWGEGAQEMCQISYTLPKQIEGTTGYLSVESKCVARKILVTEDGTQPHVNSGTR